MMALKKLDKHVIDKKLSTDEIWPRYEPHSESTEAPAREHPRPAPKNQKAKADAQRAKSPPLRLIKSGDEA